jgi:predicted transcriptional regulator
MSLVENVNRKFWWQFSRESLPSRQSVHYLVSKLKTTGSIPDNNLGRKQTLLMEAKLHDTGARLEISPRISLK